MSSSAAVKGSPWIYTHSFAGVGPRRPVLGGVAWDEALDSPSPRGPNPPPNLPNLFSPIPVLPRNHPSGT